MIRSLRILTLIVLAGMILVLLPGCGQRELLSNVSASSRLIQPNGDGINDTLTINYTIGRPATLTAYVEDARGERYTLRDNVPRVPSREPYTLVFDGTVAGKTPEVRQQVLPDGAYTWRLEARAQDTGEIQTASGSFEVRDASAELPTIEDLQVTPRFSPNEDAVDDVAYFTYRLPVSATVSINIADASGNVIPFITDLPEGPYAQSHIWNGRQPNGALVSAGTYTYTITARDEVGNIVERSGQIEVENPGRAVAAITFVHIAPVEVAIGNAITVTARVKNIGDVPIRTQGPPSGHQYTTNVSFSSIEEQRWAEKGGGFWRLGLDWGGGRAYPFRWALSDKPMDQWTVPGAYDTLEPGEEVEVTGSVIIEQREDRMEFFAGLVHEGVGYPVNNVGRTLVCVGIPGIEDRCPRRN